MLSELYKNLNQNSQNPSNEDLLGLDFSIEKDRLIKFFNRGWWHTVPFAADDENISAVRLMPTLSVEEMPIVQCWKNLTAITMAPTLSTFIGMTQMKFISEPDLIEYLIEDWDNLMKTTEYFRTLVGTKNEQKFIIDYVQNKDNQEHLEDDDQYDRTLVDIWKKVDPSKGHHYLRKIIDSFNADKNLVVVDTDVDYNGIWKSRIENILTYLAYVNGRKLNFTGVESTVWLGLSGQHQFDYEDIGSLGHDSSAYLEPSVSMRSVVSFFADPGLKREYSKQITDNPLFPAVQALYDRYGSYNGAEHVAAAALLDGEYDDPFGAWNALTVASYWSGVNSNTPNIPAWEAAIYLSEKRKWLEINKVLKEQLNFYQANS